jgi:two-component system chemotaxis response regulator CheY
MILAKTLRELGFEVREAANGREALEVMAAEQAAVRLVLADWNMPEMNGLELIRRLRQDPAFASLVVVMVTTETELDQMAAALDAGANEYVMKPFTREILVEKLRLAGIHHEQPVSESQCGTIVAPWAPVMPEPRVEAGGPAHALHTDCQGGTHGRGE